MPNVLIRDLPPEPHGELTRRAAARGQSLQAYLVAELTALAERPTLDDLLDRIERTGGGTTGGSTAVEDLAAVREERAQQLDQ